MECWNGGGPSATADFAMSAPRWDLDVHTAKFCRNYYALKTVQRLGGAVRVDGQEVDCSDTSESESSSDDSA